MSVRKSDRNHSITSNKKGAKSSNHAKPISAARLSMKRTKARTLRVSSVIEGLLEFGAAVPGGNCQAASRSIFLAATRGTFDNPRINVPTVASLPSALLTRLQFLFHLIPHPARTDTKCLPNCLLGSNEGANPLKGVSRRLPLHD